MLPAAPAAKRHRIRALQSSRNLAGHASNFGRESHQFSGRVGNLLVCADGKLHRAAGQSFFVGDTRPTLPRTESEEMTVTSQNRHGRQSWKDSPRAKMIAGTISLLLGVGLIVALVFAISIYAPRHAALISI
jgi:hypothetical protein